MLRRRLSRYIQEHSSRRSVTEVLAGGFIKRFIFWDSLPTSQNKLLPSCVAYYSALKMEATCSSEMSVDFHRLTGSHSQEEKNTSIFMEIKINIITVEIFHVIVLYFTFV
jgi:hypothetical protein